MGVHTTLNNTIKSIDQYRIDGITYIIIGEFHSFTDSNLFDQFLIDMCEQSEPFELFLETPFIGRLKYRFKRSFQNRQDLINKKKSNDSIRDIREQAQRSDCQMRVHAVDIRPGTWAKSYETFADGEIWNLGGFQVQQWLANYGLSILEMQQEATRRVNKYMKNMSEIPKQLLQSMEIYLKSLMSDCDFTFQNLLRNFPLPEYNKHTFEKYENTVELFFNLGGRWMDFYTFGRMVRKDPSTASIRLFYGGASHATMLNQLFHAYASGTKGSDIERIYQNENEETRQWRFDDINTLKDAKKIIKKSGFDDKYVNTEIAKIEKSSTHLMEL